MDYSAEKIDLRHARMADANPMLEAVATGAPQEGSEPLKGVLVGLVLSLPIWALGFLAFKLF